MAPDLNTVTVSVAAREDVTSRALAAFHGEAQSALILFATVDLLRQTLSRKRRDILPVMTGQEELSIREVARRVGRGVKAVHGEVTAMVEVGVIDRARSGDPCYLLCGTNSVPCDQHRTEVRACATPPARMAPRAWRYLVQAPAARRAG